MSDSEENFMDLTSCCDVPLRHSPKTMLSMLNQTDSSHNTMIDIFSQSNTPRDLFEQRSGGLGERLATRREFQLPTLDRNIISPNVAFFRSSQNVLSSDIPISPEFSPSAFLQSPNMLSDSSEIPLSTIINNIPSQTTESSDENFANKLVSNNDFPHEQPMHVDPPPREGSNAIVAEESHEFHVEPNGAPLIGSFEYEADVNILSMKEENKDDEDEEDDKEDKDRDIVDVDKDEEKHEDRDIIDVDELDVNEISSLQTRKCDNGSNIGAIRFQQQKKVIIRMECEEENPDDGFQWRKYGRKIVKGNTNPRGYYRCTYVGCKVKKHVEREAGNNKILVTTYDGIHEHHAPAPRYSSPRSHKVSSQHVTNRNGLRLGRSPSKSLPHMDSRPPFTWLCPQTDMTQLYMTGHSKLSSLPVSQSSSFMNWNGEPVNQSSSFMNWNGEPVNQDPSFMFQNQKMCFMSQRNQPVNQNLGYVPVNKNSSLVSKNDQLTNHKLDFMDHNGQNSRFFGSK